MKMRTRRRILANIRRHRPRKVQIVYSETRTRSIHDFFKEWMDHLGAVEPTATSKPGKPLADKEANQGWSPEVVLEVSPIDPDLKETSCLKNLSATS